MNTIMASAGLARSGNPRPLDGRGPVTPGSTSGMGLGIANALAANGTMIVLNGIAEPVEAEKLCQVIGARYEVPVQFDAADMAKPDAIRDMVERVGRSFGPVDILVN